VEDARFANDSSLIFCSIHIVHFMRTPQVFGVESPSYRGSIINEILRCPTVDQSSSCNCHVLVSKCNRYFQGVHCASIHSIQAHCLYPGCTGRASQKPCLAHKSLSNLVRSSSFINHIRSKALPPLPSCSLGEEGPLYTGAGSAWVSVALIAGVVGTILTFLGHCLDMWPCAWQLKHCRSLSSVFLSSLVRNAARLYCPLRGCIPPPLLLVVLTTSTSMASLFRHQLFPFPFKACSHLLHMSLRRNGLVKVALFSVYTAWCALATWYYPCNVCGWGCIRSTMAVARGRFNPLLNIRIVPCTSGSHPAHLRR
jgi:hypothetical protein